MSGDLGWYVQYRSKAGRDLSSRCDTRQQAIQRACQMIGQDDGVKRIVGPLGEFVDRSELLARHYPDWLAKGPR